MYMKNRILRFRQVLEEEEVSREDIIDLFINYIDEEMLLKIIEMMDMNYPVDVIKNMEVKKNE
tara:strand:+ start:3147 stop:3335 length:189 start_codon:yes stop_codon:yes gene_type:complete